MILLQRERCSCTFPCFRRGRVWAEPSSWVKGRVPCGFLGQRPKPSESLQRTISTDFQGSSEPFLLARFFIDHLTLPFGLSKICRNSRRFRKADLGDERAKKAQSDCPAQKNSCIAMTHLPPHPEDISYDISSYAFLFLSPSFLLIPFLHHPGYTDMSASPQQTGSYRTV